MLRRYYLKPTLLNHNHPITCGNLGKYVDTKNQYVSSHAQRLKVMFIKPSTFIQATYKRRYWKVKEGRNSLRGLFRISGKIHNDFCKYFGQINPICLYMGQLINITAKQQPKIATRMHIRIATCTETLYDVDLLYIYYFFLFFFFEEPCETSNKWKEVP